MRAIIDGTEIDIARDELPRFTYSTEDLDDIAAIRGSRSTTLRVPATNRNRRILGGYAMSEAHRTGMDFKVVDGSAVQFDGTAYVRERSDAEATFIAVGDNAGWISAIGGVKLREIAMGGTDIIDRSYVIGTWTDENDPLYFPVIDYGNLEFRPWLDNVEFQYLRPAIRPWKFITKAFADKGYHIGASGRFAPLWKKLVMPNVNKTIPISDSYKASTSATFSSGGQALGIIANNTWVEVGFGIVNDDPSGAYTGGGRYTVPFTLSTSISLRLSARAINLNGGAMTVTVQLYNFTTNDVIQQRTYPPLSPLNAGIAEVFTFNPLTVAVGNQIGFRIRYVRLLDPGDNASLTIESASCIYNTMAVEYQSGVQLDIASQAPDLKVIDVLKWICSLYCIRVSTRGSAITLSHYDDAMADPSDGFVDLSRRTTGLAVKVTDQTPSRVLFLHERDDKDRLVNFLLSTQGDYGAGDALIDVGGDGDEKEVKVGFASTAMAIVLDEIEVPAMRNEDSELSGSYYADTYAWRPRLLVADGLQPSLWNYAGGQLTEAPRCYSYDTGNGGAYSSLFGSIARDADEATSGGIGNVSRHWVERVRRWAGPRLQVLAYWHDHEVASLDLCKPVRVHDGQMPGYYYLMELEQHRFGMGIASRTTLVPL